MRTAARMRDADAHFIRLMDKPALEGSIRACITSMRVAKGSPLGRFTDARRQPLGADLVLMCVEHASMPVDAVWSGICTARWRQLRSAVARGMHLSLIHPSEHEVSCHTLVLPAGSGQEGVPTLDLSNRHYIRRGGCVDDPRSLWGFFASRVRCPGYRPTLITTFGASIGAKYKPSSSSTLSLMGCTSRKYYDIDNITLDMLALQSRYLSSRHAEIVSDRYAISI